MCPSYKQMKGPASSVRYRSLSALRIREKLLVLILLATLTSVSFGYVIYTSNGESDYQFQSMEDLPTIMNNRSEQPLTLPNGEDADVTTRGRRNKIREVKIIKNVNKILYHH